MSWLARKFKYTRDLEDKLSDAEVEARVFKDQNDLNLNEVMVWKTYAEELEEVKGVRDIGDLTTLAQAVLEYRKCLSLLGAPDPVDARLKVEEIFEKYNINLPSRPHDR